MSLMSVRRERSVFRSVLAGALVAVALASGGAKGQTVSGLLAHLGMTDVDPSAVEV